MINYDKDITEEYDYGEIMSVDEFKNGVSMSVYTDYDGYGYPIKNGMLSTEYIVSPSFIGSNKTSNGKCPGTTIGDVPEDATDIIWFNK